MTVALGLMSGTSMDGVDAVVCQITQRKKSLPKIEFIAHTKTTYPSALRQRLIEVSGPNGTAEEICALDSAVGEVFAKAANKAIALAEKLGWRVDVIGSHGQTVRHLPKARSTLQIGSPAVISARTGVDVWSGFRHADMARGGQGAPLAPIVHLPLFGDDKKDVAVVNIGGIANLTFIPAGARSLAQLIAYDTGPGNMLIDYAVEKAGFGSYDRAGLVAADGNVNQRLFEQYFTHPFIWRKPPKSTGREEFGGGVFFHQMGTPVKWDADLIATITELTAASIFYEIRKTAHDSRKPLRVVVCGGGAKNVYLMSRLRSLLGFPTESVEVESSKKFGLSPEYVEGALMALLAYYAENGVRLDLSNVTGAKSPSTLGIFTPA